MAMRPSNGSFLDFQSLIKLRVLEWTKSKFSSIYWSLLSKFMPRSLNLRSQARVSSGQILILGSWLVPIGITFVLSRFAESPEICLKASMKRTQARSEVSDLLMVKVVSSAKVCARISELPRLRPLMCLLVVILMRRISTTIIKNKRRNFVPLWDTLF